MKNTKQQVHSETPDVSWVKNAIKGMLRPIVKICIGYVRFDSFLGIAREVYIEEGKDFLIDGGAPKVTKSSLSLLTGVEHRAIDAVEEHPTKLDVVQLSVEAAVLGAWSKDPLFHDDDGQPKELRLYGKGPTFQRLVQRVAGRGITPNSVLESLLEGGNVAQNINGSVRMNTKVFVPKILSRKNQINTASATWQYLGKSAYHNLNRTDSDVPWFLQNRWTRQIAKEDVANARSEIRTILEDAIGKVEGLLEQYEQPTRQADHETVGVTAFYWESGNHKIHGEKGK